MSNLTSVGVTAGVPTSGTGTVSTIDGLISTGLTVNQGTSPWVTSVSSVTGVAQGSTTSGQTGDMIMGAVTTSVPSYTTAQTSPLSLDTSGNLRTTSTQGALVAGTAIIGKVTTDQTTHGTTDLVAADITKVGGSALALGTTTASASIPVTLASDGVPVTALSKFSTGYYVTVAASQTATVLQSSTGATGDYISGILVIPATTSPGNVLLLDNATSITVFTGGTSSVTNLVPFLIPLGAVSRSGAWKLTTGANVSCMAVGKFS